MSFGVHGAIPVSAEIHRTKPCVQYTEAIQLTFADNRERELDILYYLLKEKQIIS